MAEIQALRMPLVKALYRGFTDTFRTKKGYISLLMNLEKSFGVKDTPTNFGSMNVMQDYQLNYVRSEPEAEGFDWTNRDITGMTAPLKQATDTMAGVMREPAGWRIPSEAISEGLVKKMQTDAATADYLNMVKKGMLDAFYILGEEQLNPTTSELAPTVAGGVNGENSTTRVLALFHCFQSGYVGNSTTSDASSYTYCGINLNDARNLGMKALTVGSGPTNQQATLGIPNVPFGVPSNANIRKKIYYPMDDRMVAPEDLTLAFADQDVYDYLVADPESREVKFGMKAMETFSYGGMFRILPNGVMVSYLSNLQRLFSVTGIHKMLFVPREEIMWAISDEQPRIDMLPIVGNPGYQNLQAFTHAKHIVRNSRRAALAYNITLS